MCYGYGTCHGALVGLHWFDIYAVTKFHDLDEWQGESGKRLHLSITGAERDICLFYPKNRYGTGTGTETGTGTGLPATGEETRRQNVKMSMISV